MSGEALLASGYAVFLLLAALVLDRLARHSHLRTDRYRTAGFTFHDHLDVWECPEGEHLRRFESDPGRRLVRYRAKPEVCNACPAKQDCTDSDLGREIARSFDAWPHSEAGRFHRGISVVLMALASLILLVALIRNHDVVEIIAIGTLLCLTSTALIRTIGALRTPESFPAAAPF